MFAKLSIVVVVLVLVGGYAFYLRTSQNNPSEVPSQVAKSPNPDVFVGSGYVAVDPNEYEVSLVNDQLIAPTRVKLTPDRRRLFVVQITGHVLAFNRQGDRWGAPYQVVKIDTSFPGFPPEEAGLVGLVFSAKYAQNHKVFLLYTFRDSDEKVKNRISVSELREKDGKIVSSEPELIFEANIEGNVSHQITDGVGVEISGEPHLMFLIGEGFKGDRAQDETLEAGKVMIIKEDGSAPLGVRPYPANPKIQALGIRNAYNLAANPFDKLGRFLIADTGPDKYDRIIFTKLFDPDGGKISQINFNWDGKQESLAKPIPDPNVAGVRDLVVLRLDETLTFTGLAVLDGDENRQTVLATVFGKTGAVDDIRGREIWKGTLISSGQPKITFEPIVKRNTDALGKIGNPIGLEVDRESGDFYFADILEGKLYQVRGR